MLAQFENAHSVNLSQLPQKLAYVNRALRILQLHSDSNGLLTQSSSERLLEHHFPELTTLQVREINLALHDLGLRDSKPGGGQHYIRMDVHSVSLAQLKENKRIPSQNADLSDDALLALVTQTLDALRKNAVSVAHPQHAVGVVQGHMALIEEVCGENTGEVIPLLKALALYRMHALAGRFVCFVNMVQPLVLTAQELEDGRPLVEWPSTLAELLPPELQVKAMDPESIINRLASACERMEMENATLARQLNEIAVRLAGMAQAYEELQELCDDVTHENRRLAEEVERLQKEQDMQQAPPPVALPAELLERVDGILRRHTQSGTSTVMKPE